MSRKREQQRDTRKELARQLGVKGTEVPDKIIDNERVTEPELSARLDIDVAKRGMFKSPGVLDVHLVLLVVDNRGARVARRLSMRGTGRAGCVAVLATTTPKQTEAVRYRRPGHFVVIALVTEGASDASDARHAAALLDDKLQIVVDGVVRASGERGFDSVGPARASLTLGGVDVVAADVLFSGAAVVGIAAVHRVNETVVLPVASSDGRFEARLAVSLRL